MQSIDGASIGTANSDREAIKGGVPPVKLWLKKINHARDLEKGWRGEAEKAIALYEGKSDSALNLYHSNIETLIPALFNSPPVPDIRRRYGDEGHIERAAADILERNISYQIDVEDHDASVVAMIKSAVVAGRGIVRFRHEPQYADKRVEHPVEGQPSTYRALIDEDLSIETVPWDKIVIGPARSWKKVPWIAFIHDMSADDLREIGCKETVVNDLGLGGEASGDETKPGAGIYTTVEVFEVWDKRGRDVSWIAVGRTDQFIKTDADPFELKAFFPIPKPVMQIERVASIIPVCPLTVYSRLIKDLGDTANRISKLTAALKVRGMYDARMKGDFEIMKSLDDDQFVSSNTADIFVAGQKISLSDLVLFWPLEEVAGVLEKLYARIDHIKQQIYEVTGLSDILRGATAASETATAQQIKATWGSQRIQRLQQVIAECAREMFRMRCEIMGRRFSFETLDRVAALQYGQPPQQPEIGHNGGPALGVTDVTDVTDGQQPPMPEAAATAEAPQASVTSVTEADKPAIEALIRDAHMLYRIDIETDSTIKADMARDQQRLNEFVGMTSQMAQAMGAMAPIMPKTVGPMFGIYTAVGQKLRLGRQAEDYFDKLAEAAEEPPTQEQQPDPAQAQAAEQAQMQAQQAHEQQAQAAQLAHVQAVEQTKGGMQQQIEDGKAQLAIALKQIELQEQGRAADAKLAFEERKFAAELELKREDQAIRREELAYNLSVQQEKSANDNAVKMRGHDVADNANALKANVELMKASDDHANAKLHADADREQADRHHAAAIKAKPKAEAAE